MVSVLSLALENREREGDKNQKTEAKNLYKQVHHTPICCVKSIRYI